ncbi:pentapeptide repeat-containing protein [Massilia sp. W12]|uniref:pentapeptide repeat-containing protein n=1 Tax=Massilia sp. W12 TaxID=3126507 RepID=UPI0030CF32BA
MKMENKRRGRNAGIITFGCSRKSEDFSPLIICKYKKIRVVRKGRVGKNTGKVVGSDVVYEQKKVDSAKAILDKSAETNRNLLIAFYALLPLLIVFCLSVTDEMLLNGSATIRVPLLSVDLPILAFALIAPLLLTAIHFDLLHNLNEHSRKLANWVNLWLALNKERDSDWRGKVREKLRDSIGWRFGKFILKKRKNAISEKSAKNKNQEKKEISRNCYPFIYDYAWIYEKKMGHKNSSVHLLPLLCWMLYCWIPFSALLIFMIKFSALQDYIYTGWHVLLLILDFVWIRKFWPPFVNQQYISKFILNTISLTPSLWFFSLYCSILYCTDEKRLNSAGDSFAKKYVEYALEVESNNKQNFSFSIVPRISIPGYQLFSKQEVLQMKHGSNEKKLDGRDFKFVYAKQGKDFSGRRFAFADFSGGDFQSSSLEMSVLCFAKLNGINLENSQLSNINMYGATLNEAKFQRANLENSNFQRASLIRADFQGANLKKAQLQHATLENSLLYGAYLYEAQMQYSIATGAHFEGAILDYVQLQDSSLDLASLQGARLNFAQLNNSGLEKTKFSGAYVEGSAFDGSNLSLSEGFDASYGNYSFDAICNPINNEGNLTDRFGRKRSNLKGCLPASSQMLPIQSKGNFMYYWMEKVCENEYTFKSMLLHHPHIITDQDLDEWIKKHNKCSAYIKYIDRG